MNNVPRNYPLVPHRVGVEFQPGRLAVIDDQAGTYSHSWHFRTGTRDLPEEIVIGTFEIPSAPD